MPDMYDDTNRRLGCEVAIHSVSKRYDSHLVLHDISMTIMPGEFFTLLGPSGCGKTTLLRAIAGFHPINDGRILFDGVDVSQRAPWDRNIGFVFQNYALWPNKTIFDNVAYGLRLRKIPRQDIQKRVRLALAQVQLDHVEERYPSEMSGGMQQRIAMARALVIDPPLLLLDEPMSNLDAKLRVSLRQELRELQKRIGVTAIYVTHDQEEALELSDRIAVMQGGKVEQLSAPEVLYARPASRFVAEFVGQANFIKGVITEQGFTPDSGTCLNLSHAFHRGPATLFVRPENVRICEAGQGLIDAIVTDARYIGRAWVYRLTIPGWDSLWAETTRRIAVDNKVGIVFDEATFLETHA
ncbi:ABC transporter ATP-binding protein [Dickeya zeae]|uniref:ABC transporter ATP-binding protein n=1 Tax=Dickeya zeae TaxID=204042 RepID=UPI00037A296F|nr:ABC transporter ATP-binding protein [Dickeya zeae]UJR55167.1 ABC transporter ATP-binding protein [Dickeya zeae MS1]UJR61207.1 ABC transporter ATP-binding protein [Dickeya zeae]